MHKLLIANRGEIAVRIARTAKEMGITTVAVYSEADARAPHVQMADEAFLIGPAPSAQSYLQIDRIIAVAKESGADAIHPGYGFLSENADFAERVNEAGLRFVGPSAKAIRMMGDKLSAKQAVEAFGVPLVPGTAYAIESVEKAILEASRIGFPVMVKASAGGGGKGMRIVHDADGFVEAFNMAVSEAEKSFGNGAVFIEKYVQKPRHIEIQVLADQHGHCVYLHERECSIQRRHQKVIEEAPSVVLSSAQRQAMGEAAVKAAQSCQYVGAGTVEFIYDASGKFYFLEMNTRLQVEHPVTECITGLDLVREQLRIAGGEPLGYEQSEIPLLGHALELRVYAEDSKNGFAPDIGTLKVYRRPQGPGIRVDDGLEEGMEISIYYDPMIAKLVVHAPNRQAAIERMLRAIQDYIIIGVETTLPFGQFVLEHVAFISGDFDTHFVQDHFLPELLREGQEAGIAAALAQFRHQQVQPVLSGSVGSISAWRRR
ncbi:MAG: acetyl-CoA carboxylase biotin carboxylase subunit [Schleiferiaceae bacterium]|nr:acetyl-CoA carboxylase biotin carboxylase subunit [Schleiferiaceae bacterium]